MALGRKTGGRKKGTPNRRSNELQTLVNSTYKHFNPVMGMVEIYYKTDTPDDVKIDILKALSPYWYPRRKAITAESDSKLLVEVNNVKYSRAQLLGLLPAGFDARWADVCSNATLQQVIIEALSSNLQTQLLQHFKDGTGE
jgi:hypothetical protein